MNDKYDSENDSLAYATFTTLEEPLSAYTNIFVDCFTTSHARMRLYEQMDHLGENMLYCDIDSAFYAKNITPIKTGDSLGEWSNELKKGIEIVSFVSSGPKDNGYTLSDGTIKGKVKGFGLTKQAEDSLTYEARKKLIDAYIKHIKEEVIVNYQQFKISRGSIKTVPLEKKWTCQYDKRVIKPLPNGDIDTLPYGF